MAYKTINPEIWSDCRFEDSDRDEKLIWFFLMTCELRTISGIFKVTVKRISDNTGIERETVKAALENGGVVNVEYDLVRGVVFLLNGFKYRPPGGNPKIVRASVLGDYRKTQSAAGHWEKFCTRYPEFERGFFTLNEPMAKGSATVEHGLENPNGIEEGGKGSATVDQPLNKNNPNPKDNNKNKDKNNARARATVTAPGGEAMTAGDLATLESIKTKVNLFLDYAEDTHFKIFKFNLVVGEKDIERLARTVVTHAGIDADLLKRCWDLYLVDTDPWLANKSRNLAIFETRLNDYQFQLRLAVDEVQKSDLNREAEKEFKIELAKTLTQEFYSLKSEFNYEAAHHLLEASDNFRERFGEECLKDEYLKEIDKGISDYECERAVREGREKAVADKEKKQKAEQQKKAAAVKKAAADKGHKVFKANLQKLKKSIK